MNDSRELILGRIRERLGRSEANASAAGAAIDAALRACASGPRPPGGADSKSLLDAFRVRSEALASTVDEVAGLTDMPRAVAAYLAEHKLAPRAVCVPDLAGLDWAGAGIGVEARAAVDADLVGITGCFRAIAETGTLMLCSGPATPATISLLPETHIAVVPASTILASMEEGWAAARAAFGQLPRAVNFISGPSRTGDIEQTIVRPAHGPKNMHVLIIR